MVGNSLSFPGTWGTHHLVGRENILPNVQGALDRAKEVHVSQEAAMAS